MVATVFIGLLLLAAIVLFVLGRKTKRLAFTRAEVRNKDFDDPNTQNEYGAERAEPKAFAENGFGYLPPSLALVPLVIALFVGFMACTTIVQAKQEGVLLTFGKPSDRTLDPGLNVHLPWQKVVTVDTTRKTDNFNNGRPNDEEDPTQDHEDIECTLGDNGIATIKASVSWQPADDRANTIYSEYRSDDPAERLREDLVVPRFRDAVNQVCGTYRPTAQIDQLDIDFTDPEETTRALQSLNLAPDFPQLSRDVEEVLEAKLNQGPLGPLVDILNVSVSRLALPGSSPKQWAGSG